MLKPRHPTNNDLPQRRKNNTGLCPTVFLTNNDDDINNIDKRRRRETVYTTGKRGGCDGPRSRIVIIVEWG